MAYSTANPPALIASPPNLPKVWVYSSADNAATVTADDYFTNGADLGMAEGDVILLTNPAGGPATAVITAANFS